MVPQIMVKKAKQSLMLYSADLVRSFFNCAQKNFFGGIRGEILLLCEEILPFLGFVQNYYCPGAKDSLVPEQGHFSACAEIFMIYS